MNATQTPTLAQFVAVLQTNGGAVFATSQNADLYPENVHGVLRRRVSPLTGTLLVLLDTRSTDVALDDASSRWYSVCVDHAQFVPQRTRQIAYNDLAVPVFCTECAADLDLDDADLDAALAV